MSERGWRHAASPAFAPRLSPRGGDTVYSVMSIVISDESEPGHSTSLAVGV